MCDRHMHWLSHARFLSEFLFLYSSHTRAQEIERSTHRRSEMSGENSTSNNNNNILKLCEQQKNNNSNNNMLKIELLKCKHRDECFAYFFRFDLLHTAIRRISQLFELHKLY